LCAEETGQPTALWTVTWEKIDTFLPHLKQVGVGLWIRILIQYFASVRIRILAFANTQKQAGGRGKPIRIFIQYFPSMRIRIQAFANTQKLNFYASYFFFKFHDFRVQKISNNFCQLVSVIG
jgi:hypothetical protein